MATAVQLEITVDSSGAVLGVKQLGDAFNKIPPPPRHVKQEFDGIESAERRAHIAGQAFARLTGFELPRGVENFIAKSKAIGPVLASSFGLVIGGTLGVAFAQMAARGLEAFKGLIESAAGYTEEVQKVRAETIAASKEAFLNPKTIDDAKQHLAVLNKQSQTLTKAAQIETSRSESVRMAVGWEQKLIAFFGNEVVNKAASTALTTKELSLQGDRQKLLENITEQEKKLNEIRSQSKLNEAGLQGFALAAQKYKDAQKEILDSGVKDAKVAASLTQAAFAEYYQATTELARQNAQETIALRHSVVEDSMSGISRIHQVEADALEDINRKRRESLLSEKEAAAQRSLVILRAAEQEKQAYRDIAGAHREAELFAKQRAASFLQGSEKIIAEGEIEKESIEKYTGKAITDLAELYAAWQDLEIKKAAIDKETNQKLIQNQQQLVDKLHDMQSAAAIAALPEWQRADAQILLDRQKTFEEINRLEARDAQNTAVYEAQKVAADQLANAQIIENHKRMTIELGADLESIYDDIGSGNIGKRILNNIKKLFFQIVAEWLLATKTMGGIFGKLFGTLLGGPQSTLENASGGGLGSLLGLFGAPAAANVSGGLSGAAGGTAGGPSALASALGLGGFFGGSAVPGTAAAGFGAAGALTTSSIASSGGGIGAVAGGALGAVASGGASKSIFGNLFTPTGVAGAGALLLGLFGGKLGGTVGQIGGTLTALSVLSQSNPAIGALLSHLGLGGELAGTLLAAAGPALLGFGVGTKFGPLGGALAGGGVGFGAGALIGLAGGPIGALIGGIIGAIAGLFGGLFGSSKRKKAANAYFDQQVGPAIKKIEDDYKGFSIDFSTAMQELEDLRTQSQKQLKSLKGQGSDVFKKKVSPAIDQAEKEINTFETERQRRAGLVFGPPQFHDGGFVSAAMQPFMRPGEIMALLKHGEFVVNPQATRRSRTQLEQINAGRAVGGGTLSITINALDARSVEQWLRGGGAQKIQDGLDRLSKEGN